MSAPAVAADVPALAARAPSRLGFALAWCAVFGVAVFLRVALFSGYGLGDDPNYYAAYHGIYLTGRLDWASAYDFRYTFSYPVVWFMKLFGVTEWGFVGFVTVCSVLNVVIVYGLARQEWDRSTALIAMLLMAVLPLEVTTATLFVIDVPLATYCYAALWCYRAAWRGETRSRGRAVAACLAGVLLFAGYLAKQWGLLVGLVFAGEALRRPRATGRASVLCAGTLVTLIALYVAGEWYLLGDPLHDFHTARRWAWFEPHSWQNTTDYTQMLFWPTQYGTWFAGWAPHVLLLLAILLPHRIGAAGKWLGYFLLQLVALSAMPSHRENGHWVILIPHIFRYLCFLSIPLVLALAAYVREVLRIGGRLGMVLVGALVVLFVQQGVALSRPTRDANGEQRRANAFLLGHFPTARFASDFHFYNRMANFDLEGRHYDRFTAIRGETPEARAEEFKRLANVIAITGGARLPWYGCIRCAANIAGIDPPVSWSLVTTLPGDVTPYRSEPLRIWQVGSAPEAPPKEPALPVTGDTADSLFKNGMTHFDANEYPAARAPFKAIIDRFPNAAEADDARYFYAVTFFRETRWTEAKAAFQSLIAANPNGRWAPAGYYHLGRCDLELRQPEEARAELQYVLDHFSYDVNTCNLAREALRSVPGAERGLVGEFADTVRGWFRR
jgi:tetratricopeptide (TPR) repeat protein